MSKRLPILPALLVALVALLFHASTGWGQAAYTASRAGDLQLGVDGVLVNSDYDVKYLRGAGFYGTFDFRQHFGVEIDFRQADSRQNDQVYERTYEVGGRYVRQYGRFSPYAKLLYGRGVFNFPFTVANLAYNEFVGGVGIDFEVAKRINVRADYEYQKWLSFPPNGLDPQIFSVGVAYHFPGDLKRGRHY